MKFYSTLTFNELEGNTTPLGPFTAYCKQTTIIILCRFHSLISYTTVLQRYYVYTYQEPAYYGLLHMKIQLTMYH